MSVPVRLTDLRTRAEKRDEAGHDWVALRCDDVLALVDAVEAAEYEAGCRQLKGQRISKQLADALARFDLGGADGQPTTTKGAEA